MANEDQLTVLVTGFGPFRNHNINASLEAVKLLPELLSKEELSSRVNLIIEEITVAYNIVLYAVKSLWEKHKPDIIIHVGVSHLAQRLVIECQANSTGYKNPDVLGKFPNEEDISQEVIKTNCQVNKICDIVNSTSTETGCLAEISNNAGRYLCEYIYYQSLSLGEPLVVFVHVPVIDVYPSIRTAQGLLKILIHLVEHVLDEKYNTV